MDVEIDNLTSIGVIQDQPPYQLPPEAWSLGQNVRAYADGMESLLGRTPTLGTNPRPSGAAPLFTMFVSGPSQPWWLWASTTDIYVYDGTSDTNITRTSGGTYNATDAKDWSGTILGGVPILSTKADVPQFWNSYSNSTKMQNLTNWPAGLTCRVIRTFAPYLLALNTTLSGTATPHRIRWSSSADPGSLPATWDYTDATHDAGQNDLPDVNSGVILDGAELQGMFFIYKESAVWRVSFIGGQFIFNFQSFLENVGLLATRCVAMSGDGLRHVFATQDDIAVHNGYTVESILTKKMRRYLFNQLDPTNYDTSFMFCNPFYEEMWFCYPQNGQSAPNHAIIWNYRHNALTEADIDFCSAMVGNINSPTGSTWAAQTQTWAQDPNPWNQLLRRKVVITNKTTKKLLQLDAGTTNDGTAVTSTLQRTGLGILGRTRTGAWLEDFERRKMITRVWPKLSQGNCNVRVGYQDLVGGAVRWGNYQAFTPGASMFVDNVQGSGRSTAIEFSGTNFFHIDGYRLDLALLGRF